MKATTGIALSIALFSGAAFAANNTVSIVPRIGPSLGSYAVETKGSISVAGNPAQPFDADESPQLAYGFLSGLRASFSDMYLDLAIEGLQSEFDNQDVNRTDIVLSAGYFIGDTWQVFAGYRQGLGGTNFFNDDNFKETGAFIGTGFGGVSAGDFNIAGSLAYNFSRIKYDVADVESESLGFSSLKFDYPGISVKLAVSPNALPQHSFQVRYQTFSGDVKRDGAVAVEGGSVPFSFKIKQTETYAQLFYVYSFN